MDDAKKNQGVPVRRLETGFLLIHILLCSGYGLYGIVTTDGLDSESGVDLRSQFLSDLLRGSE